MAGLVAKNQRSRLWFTSVNLPLTATVKMNTAFQEHAVDSAKGTLTRKMIAPLCVAVVVSKGKQSSRRDFVTAKRVLMSPAAAISERMQQLT